MSTEDDRTPKRYQHVVIGGGVSGAAYVNSLKDKQGNLPQDTLVISGPDPWGDGSRQELINHPENATFTAGPRRQTHNEDIFRPPPSRTRSPSQSNETAFTRGSDLSRSNQEILHRSGADHVDGFAQSIEKVSQGRHQGHLKVSTGEHEFLAKRVTVASGLGEDRLPPDVQSSAEDQRVMTLSDFMRKSSRNLLRQNSDVHVIGANAGTDAVNQALRQDHHVTWMDSRGKTELPISAHSQETRDQPVETGRPGGFASTDDKAEYDFKPSSGGASQHRRADYVVFAQGQSVDEPGGSGNLVSGLVKQHGFQAIPDRNRRVDDSGQAMLGLHIDTGDDTSVNIVGSAAKQTVSSMRRNPKLYHSDQLSPQGFPSKEDLSGMEKRLDQVASTLPGNIVESRQLTPTRNTTEMVNAHVPPVHGDLSPKGQDFLNLNYEDRTTLRAQIAQKYQHLGPDALPTNQGNVSPNMDLSHGDYVGDLLDEVIQQRSKTPAGFQQHQLQAFHSHLSTLDDFGARMDETNQPIRDRRGSQAPHHFPDLDRADQKALSQSRTQMRQTLQLDPPPTPPATSPRGRSGSRSKL